MAKKRLKIKDRKGNVVDYDISAASITIDAEGKSLTTKLTELGDADDAAVKKVTFNGNQHYVNSEEINIGNQMQPDWNETSTTYPTFIKNKPSVVTGIKVGASGSTITPTNGVVTLPEGGQTIVPDTAMLDNSENVVQNKVIKAYVDAVSQRIDTLIGSGNVQGAIDTFNEVVAFLNGINSSNTLAAKLALKANSADVYSKSEVDAAVAEAGGLTEEDIDVSSNQDGTFTIHVVDTDYTINLNHTHENMARLVVCEESDLPSTLAKDTIYAQVDDAETPTEIQSLWIAGLEFAGGGGSADTPVITKPSGTTINLGTNDGSGVSAQVEIKGRNLTGDLTVAIAANNDLSFDTTNLPSGVTYNSGEGTLTIAQAAALVGVVITIMYGGSGAADIEGGLVILGGGTTAKSLTLTADYFPAGYTRLNSIKPVVGNTVVTNITATDTTWRLKAVGMYDSKAEVIISRGLSLKGAYFGILPGGVWGLTAGNQFSDISMGTEIEAIVSFAADSISVTIGDTTLTEQTTHTGNNKVRLFNTDNYPFIGYIHEVECINGASCHLYPAKRISDNEVGLYDVENDTFYTGFEESNI